MNLYKKILILCSITATAIVIALSVTHKKNHDDYKNIHEFYFIRHGQTDFNAGLAKIYTDMPLNEVGQKQAQNIEPIIAALPIRSICYSPLLRAKETKDIITAHIDIPEYEIDDLKEINASSKTLWKIRTHGLLTPSPFVQRFIQQVHHGLQKSLSKPGPVLIVAHGGVYKIICHLLRINHAAWNIGNCVPVHFYKNAKGTWKVEKIIATHFSDTDPKMQPISQ